LCLFYKRGWLVEDLSDVEETGDDYAEDESGEQD